MKLRTRKSSTRPEAGLRRLLALAECRSGIAATEFAILAPFLVTVVIGLIEIGRVLQVEQALNNAAREGCRVGSLSGKYTTDVMSAAQTCLVGPDSTHPNLVCSWTNSGWGSNSAQISVSVNGTAVSFPLGPTPATDPIANAVAGDVITVTVTIPFNSGSKASWLATPMFMNGANLTATVVMRKQSNSL